MRSFLARLMKLAIFAAVVAAVARGFQWFQGSPETVGDESFAFGTDDAPYAVDESKLGGDVSPELLERLVCPLDKGPLDLVDGKWLVNPRNGYRYPIVDGIPVMLVDVGERYKVNGSSTSVATVDAPES
jgi:uncharacterized protein YbaR (Trm112 family)